MPGRRTLTVNDQMYCQRNAAMNRNFNALFIWHSEVRECVEKSIMNVRTGEVFPNL